jgi:hypothetical protein
VYFHTVAYTESLGAVTNSDVDAVVDTVLTSRNSHLITTTPYNLLAVCPFGSTLSRLRFGNAGLTQLGSNHIWPQNVSATIPDRPAVMDLRDYPMEIPQNEELTIEATTSAAGPAQTGAVLWLGTPEWNMNVPPARDRFIARATATIVAASETTWSTLANITMERDLLNGVYSVIGAWCTAANALAFRLHFPSQRQVRGKHHRPGGLVQDTLALTPWPAQDGGFGEWGRFHTFELPQVQVLADAAGGTYDVRLDLLYLGDSLSLLGV